MAKAKRKAKAKQVGEYRETTRGRFTTAAAAARDPHGTTHETNRLSPKKSAALRTVANSLAVAAASLAKGLEELYALVDKL